MLESRTRWQTHAALGYCCLLASCLAGCGTDEAIRSDHPEPPAPPFHPREINAEPGARRLVELAAPGQVPYVAEQATPRGRNIGALGAFGARVFLGFGDYDDNTGPIASVSFSVTEQTFKVGGFIPTEEVLEFQTHRGELFAADLDPRGHEALGSVFRLTNETADWQKMSDIAGAVHTFSMTEYQGRLYATSGSVVAGAARVVSTDDGGATWRDEHTTQSPPDTFSRYTHIAASNASLFVSGRVHGTPEVPFAYSYSAGQWTPLSGLPSAGFLIPVVLGEHLIVAQFSGDRGKGGVHQQSFELTDGSLVPAAPLPAGERLVNWSRASDVPALARPGLWVLAERDDQSQAAHLARAFDDWELVAELPELPDADRFTAITYLDDHLYLATVLGGLYAIEEVFELVE